MEASLALLPVATPIPGEVVGVGGPPGAYTVIFCPWMLQEGLARVEEQIATLPMATLPSARLSPGQPCLARFSEDGRHYR